MKLGVLRVVWRCISLGPVLISHYLVVQSVGQDTRLVINTPPRVTATSIYNDYTAIDDSTQVIHTSTFPTRIKMNLLVFISIVLFSMLTCFRSMLLFFLLVIKYKTFIKGKFPAKSWWSDSRASNSEFVYTQAILSLRCIQPRDILCWWISYMRGIIINDSYQATVTYI